MKQQYKEIRLSRDRLAIIEKVNTIIDRYLSLHYLLTVRQIFYQLVTENVVPNTERSYKNVGDIISKGRDAGLIDWDAIEDRGRHPILPASWEDPAQILRIAADGFRVDRWQGQQNYVEVMVEKDALSGILRPVCSQLHVRVTANKGYSSSTAMRDAGIRFMNAADEGRDVHLIYLGDHDPSGINMTDDIEKRLIQYGEYIEGNLDVKRLALNMDQVQQWNPPPNPAKQKDSRFAAYAKRFGRTSWELDAIRAEILGELVRDAITDLIDRAQWNKIQKMEKEYRAQLTSYADEWEARQKNKKKGKGK